MRVCSTLLCLMAAILPLASACGGGGPAPGVNSAAAVAVAAPDTAACAGVAVSRQQMLIGSTQASQGGQPLPAGAVVTATVADGTRVGCVVLTTPGQFRLVVNGDDHTPETAGYPHESDPIALQVNGRPVPDEAVVIVDSSLKPPPAHLVFASGTPVQYAVIRLSL